MTWIRTSLRRTMVSSRELSRNPLTWVVLGFSAGYLLYFVRPAFGGPVMQFPAYIDALDPIGWDLRVMLGNVRAWLLEGPTPYLGANPYPPIASAFFAPLLLLEFETAYRGMVAATLLAYVFLSFGVPRLFLPRNRTTGLSIFFLVTGLTSYGLQFEIERGQFNVIAVALAILGVILCRRWPRVRMLGYVCFVLAVQLKVYPIAFAPLLVEDWKAWRSWVPQMGGILIASLACLFLLGTRLFGDFLEAITKHGANPGIWVGNHSARSFASQLPGPLAIPAEIVILCAVGMCLTVAVVVASRARGVFPHPALVLACTLAVLVIPTASHDYKLALLAGPSAGFLGACLGVKVRPHWGAVRAVSLVFFTLAYSATLVSYTSRASFPGLSGRVLPLLTENALPVIMTMLVSATVLAILPAVEPNPLIANIVPEPGAAQPVSLPDGSRTPAGRGRD